MSDDADLTQERMELEDKIRRQYTQRRTREVNVTGFCLNCGQELPAEMRWCDSDCQQDWQKRRDMS